MQGTVLGIGNLSAKITAAIEKNEHILNCYLLEVPSRGLRKKKLKLRQRSKTVNIKKIRKVFKKKRIDNIICHYETIKDFLKTFIRDSVYITKGTIYIYGEKADLEKLIKRYNRYTQNIEVQEKEDVFVLTIDIQNAQNHKFKDMAYWWADTLEAFVDFMTIILVN